MSIPEFENIKVKTSISESFIATKFRSLLIDVHYKNQEHQFKVHLTGNLHVKAKNDWWSQGLVFSCNYHKKLVFNNFLSRIDAPTDMRTSSGPLGRLATPNPFWQAIHCISRLLDVPLSAIWLSKFLQEWHGGLFMSANLLPSATSQLKQCTSQSDELELFFQFSFGSFAFILIILSRF